MPDPTSREPDPASAPVNLEEARRAAEWQWREKAGLTCLCGQVPVCDGGCYYDEDPYVVKEFDY